ncbi:uncharacterized protein LOC144643236 [Oculina patagonica]
MRDTSSVNTVAFHISQCVLNDLLEVSYQMMVDFFKIRSGSLTTSFLPWCNVAMTNCFAAKSAAWPCQRDKDIKALLSDSLINSRVLAEQISVVRGNMSRRWPPSPFNATNIGFFGPRPKLNKTVKPEQILKANIHILRTFVILLDNSTNQLSRFPVAKGLVTTQLVGLERTDKDSNKPFEKNCDNHQIESARKTEH